MESAGFAPASLLFLATHYLHEFLARDFYATIPWCPRQEFNPQPSVLDTAALAVELQGHIFLEPRDGIKPPTFQL